MISLLALLLATGAPAPPPADKPLMAAAAAPGEVKPDLDRNLSPAERAWVASAVYRTVKEYFAHWSGLPPTYDFDAAYRSYLAEALAAPDRRGFSLATMRLVAGLNNGHTGFTDDALWRDVRASPFYAKPVDGRWTVTVSRSAGLKPGDVISAIDGVPVETWIAPIRQVVGESSPRARDQMVFTRWFMFPDRFVVDLIDGRRAPVSRDALGPSVGRIRVEQVTVTRRADGVVVIAIPSFDDPHFEVEAVRAVRAAAGARLIVLDVRGNGGGDTPEALLAAIMTRPYAGTAVLTPLVNAMEDAQQSFSPDPPRTPQTFLHYSQGATRPDPQAYAGPMALLVDDACASACEDFAIRFQSGRRGPVLGEPTFGSTGQPIQVRFPELGMSLRVSTKRESFADGTLFEGFGVTPDISIPVTRLDFAAVGDPVLERAVEAALSRQGH